MLPPGSHIRFACSSGRVGSFVGILVTNIFLDSRASRTLIPLGTMSFGGVAPHNLQFDVGSYLEEIAVILTSSDMLSC